MNLKVKTVGGVIAVLIVIVIGLFGFTTQKNKTGAVSSIKLGVITGATGQYAVVGENYVKGAELARDVWLQKHPDQKIDLVIEDDGFSPKKGLSAYQKLIGFDKVDAIMNMTSPTIDAIYSNAQQSGIPVAQGFEQGIEPTDDNVFQLFPGNIATEIALGKSVKEKGYKKVVAFYANNATYVRFLNGFEKGYGDGGVIEKFPIAIEGRDYRSNVTKALAKNPDAILFIATPEQGAILIKNIREQTKQQYPYIFDANVQTGFSDYKKLLGDTNILNGSMVVVVRQHLNPEFIGRFKAKYGSEPGIATDLGYDSFDFLMRTHASTWPEWLKNMKSASFEGAGGKVVLDDVGVRTPDFVVGTIENGVLPQ